MALLCAIVVLMAVPMDVPMAVLMSFADGCTYDCGDGFVLKAVWQAL